MPAPVPGTIVLVGSSLGPGGDTGQTGATGPLGPTGPTGPPARTITAASFTVPPVGSTVVIALADTSWCVLGEMVAVQNAGGSPTASGTLQIVAINPPNVTLLNPSSVTNALATTSGPGLLNTISGLTTDFVDGTNACQDLSTAISINRQRAYNALGNPTFEVDQANAGASIVWPIPGSVRAADRWYIFNASSSMAGKCQQMSGIVPVPGTNFSISQKFLRCTLTTQAVTLGASDVLYLLQFQEGIQIRELLGGVHSAQILVRSSVAGLAVSLNWFSETSSDMLATLCTIPTANTWTLIPKPNLPAFTPGFVATPGTLSAAFQIILAAGSSYVPIADSVWVLNSSQPRAVVAGQSNFAASPVNSTFDIAFVQNQPGPLCTAPIDKPFAQNLIECKRYFQKSYPYATFIGTASGSSYVSGIIPVSALTNVTVISRFEQELAKSPTMVSYNSSTGNINSAFNLTTAVSYNVSSVTADSKGITYITVASGAAAGHVFGFHYTADTGW